MELWIRSQNRLKLVKVYDMWIDDTDMVEQNYVVIMVNSSFDLGIYKTRERALEILDEIQNFIERKDIEGNRYYEGKIYEMPQE